MTFAIQLYDNLARNGLSIISTIKGFLIVRNRGPVSEVIQGPFSGESAMQDLAAWLRVEFECK